MALITTLIDKVDNKSIVRDQIAGVLKLESENQEALAEADGRDKRDWALAVYTERTNPWGDYIDTVGDVLDAPRIVNVEFESMSYDGAASNVVERQKGTAVYNIDCFGFGQSRADQYGHIPGDMQARLSAERALCLARNILMAGHYTYLDLRGLVWRRFPNVEQVMDVPLDQQGTARVAVARLQLHVDFSETSPQVVGETIESVYATVLRKETGEIYFNAAY